MTPEETAKPKRTRKPKEEVKHLCHISDNIKSYDHHNIDELRESVCQNLSTKEHSDGKHYCFLHLPVKSKDCQKFAGIIDERFAAIALGAANIEATMPEVYWEERKRKLYNDLRFVWFPLGFKFYRQEYIGHVLFNSATFTGSISFSEAKFMGDVEFSCATFMNHVRFVSTTFLRDVYFDLSIFEGNTYFGSSNFNSKAFFDSVTFTGSMHFGGVVFGGDADFNSTTINRDCSFISATFSSSANFSSTNFSGSADFSLAIFNGETKFDKTKFGKTGETQFIKTKFEGDVLFERTRFRNLVSFNAAVFGKESDIIFLKSFFAEDASFKYTAAEGYLRFINLRQGEENRFNFEEAAFEKASRISFNKVRLRPNWFINIDSRKFSFTNISWENHKASNIELTEELESLEKRKHKEPDNFRLLIIAFRNLATNSEEFNRLEDASNFRESAFECEKLERKHKQKDWLTNVSKTLDKKFICWDFFSETKTVFTELWKLIKHAPFDLVHFLYRLLSFYGESWFRAAWILVAVWFVFGIAYLYFGEFGANGNEFITFGKSLAYSLSVMTLQKPEPRPFSTITYILYGLETILAPLQAALLALAIRRKFMR